MAKFIATFISRCTWIMLLAVVSLLVCSAAALIWGVGKTLKALDAIFNDVNGQSVEVPYYLIHAVDAFLIAMVLFMFAASVYELFIGKLDVPDWIPAHNFYELKNKLGGMIVLVMAVEFLERLFKGEDALQLLYIALSVAVVSGVLIGFGLISGKPAYQAKQVSGPNFADEQDA